MLEIERTTSAVGLIGKNGGSVGAGQLVEPAYAECVFLTLALADV